MEADHTHGHAIAEWGRVEEFRRERAQRIARARVHRAGCTGTTAKVVVLDRDHPVVVSLAAYREQLSTGQARNLDYAGALIEWLRVGETLSPESLQVAVSFMMGWPAHVSRPHGQVLPFKQG